MTIPAFDTLTAAEDLQRDYGFEERQAQGIAKLVHHQLTGNVATKDDVAALKEDIEGVKDDVKAVKDDVKAVKDDVKVVDAKIDRVESRLDAKIDAVAARLEGKIDAVAGRLDGKIDAMEKRMGQTFATKAEMYKLIGGQTVVIVGVLIAFRFFA